MEAPHAELAPPPSPPACAALKADGQPCRARPIPGSDYCPFHHPDHAPAFAEGRSQGGAAPRRRVRRLPLVLDHIHIAEFLSELMVEGMNAPSGADPRRIQTLANLSRVLLKTVGCPKGYILFHHDRRDTPAHLPHLRRYDPPAPDPQPDPAPPASSPPAAAVAGPPSPSDAELLGPVFQTLKMHDPELEFRKRVLWLEPDGSLENDPWGVPPPASPAAPGPDLPASFEPPPAPMAPAPAEPRPPVIDPPSGLEGHRPVPSGAVACPPCPPEPPPLGPPGQAPEEPAALAPDKRQTSAPATNDEKALAPFHRSLEGNASPGAPLPTPEADRPAPLEREPGAAPAGEPAPPPRRPCIALTTTRPAPGSLRPWSEPPLLPWEGRHGRVDG